MLESWKINSIPNKGRNLAKDHGMEKSCFISLLYMVYNKNGHSLVERQKGYWWNIKVRQAMIFVKIETKLISCVAFWTYMLWNWTIILGRRSTRGKWWYRPKQWTSLMQCDIMWIIALSLNRWIVQLQSVWEQTNQLEGKHEGNDQVRSLASQSWTGSGAAAQEDAEVQEDHRGQETRNNNQRLTYMLTGRGRSV